MGQIYAIISSFVTNWIPFFLCAESQRIGIKDVRLLSVLHYLL